MHISTHLLAKAGILTKLAKTDGYGDIRDR